ncbi:Protein of unknown function (DUF674 [Striga hermonthica]|uniref:DUF674 family protein n=1 Tax=Striga hermonthica TaxID=68872 RepID=A0A9N7MNA8_STRHE|nr:Protein of unknown function (DUF674 [Striga hermonthica]
MSNPKDFKFTLKAIINKQKTKVLYVEADSDFADVLLSFLTLPLGTIVRVLNKHYGDEAPVVGSLTTLYNGLRNLDNGFFLLEDCKNLLLNPIRSSEVECRRLKINVDDTPPTRYFICGDTNCFPTVSMYFSGLKCDCGKPLDKNIYVRGVDDGGGGVFIANNGFAEGVISFSGTTHGTYSPPKADEPRDRQAKYVKGQTMYMVTDDLTVTPLSSTSGLSVFNSLKIPLSKVKELELAVGLEEALSILESISDFVSRLNRWPYHCIFNEKTEARGLKIYVTPAGARAIVFITSLTFL